MTQTIPLTHATTGMVLADALQDASGAVLLPAGCVLTAAMMHALERRGVASITIGTSPDVDDVDDADDASDLASTEQITARIEHVFRRGSGTAHDALQAAITAFKLPNKS